MADRDISERYPLDRARAADAAAYRARGLEFLAAEGLAPTPGDGEPVPATDVIGPEGQTWPTNYDEWFCKGWPLNGTGP
jgi:hypothetical protein